MNENGICPDLILATDVVFDGSPYDHFVKVCENVASRNKSLKVLVVMPSKKDRKESENFLKLMTKNGSFHHTRIDLGQKFFYKAVPDEKESDMLFPGLKAYEFDLHIFNVNPK